MENSTRDSIAQSMETSTKMLPYLPELLTDMWALGCSLDQIIDLVESLNLPAETTKVLDLGCGKGAVLVNLASKFGFQVTGIDASDDFLEEAKRKADEFHVAERCDFRLGDIREFIKKPSEYDMVVFASLGGILGPFDECVGKLRRTIRPGGYMIIDDGYLKGNTKIQRSGYGHYVSRQEALKQLTSHGDVIVKEVSTVEESKKINEEYLAALKTKAEAIQRTMGAILSRMSVGISPARQDNLRAPRSSRGLNGRRSS